MTKLRGEGLSPLFYRPPSPSLMAPLRPCLSQVIPPLRNLTCHWLNSHPPRDKKGKVKGTEAALIQGDKVCVLSGLWSQGLSTQPQPGGVTASETRQGGSQQITFAFQSIIKQFCCSLFWTNKAIISHLLLQLLPQAQVPRKQVQGTRVNI